MSHIPPVQMNTRQRHTEEIHEIITTPPKWVLRWGITIIFSILVMLVSLSVFIRYPDIVKTQLKINSYNSPKPVITKISGRLIKILVKENEKVSNDQPLAYVESTAKHGDVLLLLERLKKLQKDFFNVNSGSTPLFNPPVQLQLGELQHFYQNFYRSYLNYKSSVEEGFYLRKKGFMQQELILLLNQKELLLVQRALQEKGNNLAKQEYLTQYNLLKDDEVAGMGLKMAKEKLLVKEYSLLQARIALIQNTSAYATKEKEILELNNQLEEVKLKFALELNTIISEIETWKSKYVLTAIQSGIIDYSGNIQENQILQSNYEVFFIRPKTVSFFGEVVIQQNQLSKIKNGQKVLVKLKSYPYEEYGAIWGELDNASEIAFKDSVFISKVIFKDFKHFRTKRPINLNVGMLADAEIITEEVSLFYKVFNNVIK